MNGQKKKDTSILIAILKERNCLWKIKCKEYKNKVLRDIATKAITEGMAKHIVGIGQDDIKKKINTYVKDTFLFFIFVYPVSRCSNASKQGVALHCCALSICLLADCREVFDAT